MNDPMVGEMDAPPQDLEAERGVLGAMLLSADAASEVLLSLDGADFYRPTHEQIYTAMSDLFRKGEPVDAITVAAALQDRGELERVGGGAYLHELIAQTVTTTSATYYARLVAKKAVLRRLRQAGQRIVHSTVEATDADVDSIVNAAQAAIYAVTEGRRDASAIRLNAALENTLAVLEAADGSQVVGVPTGFARLDQLIGGLRPGHLVVVAARPSVGKSTFALNVARHAACVEGVPTLLFTLEMSADAVTKSILAAQAHVDLTHLDRAVLNHREWEAIARALKDTTAAPLWIDDTSSISLAHIRAKARRQAQQSGLGLVLVDYLQLMTSERRSDNRQVEVAEISRGLKLLAKELNVPVVALSQLNRGVEQRADRRPMLSDMRESGAIEQDADLVMFVHRSELYDLQDRPGEADIIVAKHRGGRTDTIPLAWQGAYARFTDMPTP